VRLSTISRLAAKAHLPSQDHQRTELIPNFAYSALTTILAMAALTPENAAFYSSSMFHLVQNSQGSTDTK